MKKIYFFLVLSFIFLFTTGQEFNTQNLPYASYKEGVQNLKSATVPGHFAKQALANDAECKIDALLLAADDVTYVTDVQTYLMNTGMFNLVDTEIYTTPTLETLRNYDAILVWADGSLNDTVGDSLAAYIDEGGGVVSAVFNLFTGWGIEGTRFNTDYLLLNLGTYTSGATTTLGTVHDANHPIMEGLTSLVNPNEFRSNNATMTAGSEVIAEWSDGLPLVVVKENLGPASARRADINIFPPSSTIRGDFWDATTDGDILLANALLWVSKKCDCADVIVDNDPGICGAIVNYDTPTAEGATVTQIDNSDFSSGDEFPVGATIQQYEFDFGGGDLDTCTFNVIVNDTEPPVFTCPEDIVVYNDPGENCAVVNLPDLGIITGGEAEPGITLPNAPTNQAGVAYNPDKKLYYAIRAGSSGYTLYTYDETGSQLAANTANFDFRGLWWNPNTSALEGSSYGGDGYRVVDLDANGYALSTGTNDPATNYQPDSQSQADYDYDLDEVIYFFNNSIYKTSRTTGALIGGAIPITGLPANTLNSTFVGYTGIPGGEALIYDYLNKAVYFVDKTTGVYSHSVQLPISAPGASYLNTSYANGHIWISDGTLWHSYKILESGASDNCGAVTATYDYPSGTCFPIGTTEVTLTATDAAGNSSTCSFNVTVVNQEEAPNVVANPIEVYLDETGRYVLTRADLEEMAAGTNDAITPFEELELSAYPHIFTCAQVYDDVIHTRLTVEDEAGNKAWEWTTVIVHDTLPPDFVPVTDIEVVLEPGLAESAIEYPVIEVLDNCVLVPELVEGLGPDGIFPAGTTTETWMVEDGGGNTATLSFTVTVITTNDLPTIDPVEDVTANEDDPPVTVELSGISYGNDMEEQTVTVTAESDNNELVSAITVNYATGSTGTLEIELAPEMSGNALITITVEDNEGGIATETFTLTVNPVNDAPIVVNPVADQVVNASYVLKVPVSSVLGELFYDSDGDELTISAMLEGGDPLPAWAEMMNDSLVFSPMIEDTGCVNIVVMATDPDGAAAADTFQLCVDGYPVNSGQIAFTDFNVNMFPNPARDWVNLEVKNAGVGAAEVTVYTITGQQIIHRKFTNNQNISFNMEYQVSGMYFVKLNIEGKEAVKKLVLDRK
ncbi:HYR domain-containing protein [Mariniphaga sp.]|uniref:HYR domain-containing protein n=1 Tax=Mariniphaga sp. TaxID=1954475 RepID=UPI003563E532